MKQFYDVVILGGGPGGYTAALYCARAGLSTLVLEKLSPGGQMATTEQIDNYPGFDEGIDGFVLAERMQRGAERFGAETEFAEAVSVDLTSQPKHIETTSGPVEAGAVILATGAGPRLLGLPQEENLRGRGVSYCATCDGMFYRGKAVAVVGGGNTAAGDVLTLAKLCSKVYLVHRRDSLRASRSYLEPLKSAENVEFVWNARPVQFEHDGRLTGLTVEDVQSGKLRTLPVDGVFVAVGRTPDTALFAGQAALDESGYLIAGEDTKTNIPGVFAVGDARTKQVRQVITACADGAIAAQGAEEFLAGL